MSRDRALVAQRAAEALRIGMSVRQWQPLPHQVPPPGAWRGWVLKAGRGAGKTDACARYMAEHVKGPPCLPGDTPHWMAIIAPTLGDAATSCFSGPSGLHVHSPDARMITVKGGTIIRWPNGSEAKLFGAHEDEDTERLRSGGNRCLAWLEELAAWRHLDAAFTQMRLGLRVGPRPHWIASTTPKPKPLIKRIDRGELPGVVVTHATTYDNPHLPQDIRDELEDAYGGTDLGRQELYAEILDEVAGALWTRAMIQESRVPLDMVPAVSRTTVGVDPSGGAGEQGIVVVSKAMILREHEDVRKRVRLAHGFVVADSTVQLSPDGWGRAAVKAAVAHDADDICVEVNYGGDMAVSTIRAAAEAMAVAIPIRKVTATRGKKIRAAPVSALTEQGRWHMVGHHPKLEEQLTTWIPEDDWSPDRLDAMVWPAWHLKIARITASGGTTGMTQMTRSIG